MKTKISLAAIFILLLLNSPVLSIFLVYFPQTTENEKISFLSQHKVALWFLPIFLDLINGNIIGNMTAIMIFASICLPIITPEKIKEKAKREMPSITRIYRCLPFLTVLIVVAFFVLLYYHEIVFGFPDYYDQESFYWFLFIIIVSYNVLGFSAILSCITLVSVYAQEKRAEEFRVTIMDVVRSRGKVSFEDLAKEYRTRSESIKKVVYELHESGLLQGFFTRDGRGYITMERLKGEITDRLK